MRSVTWLMRTLGQIFLLFLKPLTNIGRTVLKTLILPLYNILHLLKKQTRNSLNDKGSNKMTVVLTSPYLLYALGILLFISVIINNLLIQNAAAEDLAKKSIFYQLAAGDEFEADIEESSLAQNVGLNQDNVNENIFTDPNQFVNKNSSLEQEKAWLPAETDANDNLALNALVKNSPSKTVSGPEARGKIIEYAISAGDTLYSIAKNFNISLNTILWANKLGANSTIRPGNKLIIPPVSGVIHQIKKGDTISALAKKYNVTAEKILAYNQIISDEQLSIGQNLIVPDGVIKAAPAPANTSLASNLRKKSSESNALGVIWPTTSRRITQYYSWRHLAIDIGGQTGAPIYAARPGKIIKSGWGTGYGNYIIIDHGDGTKTLYGHMSKLYAKNGEQVEQGAVIGALGSTGWSTGPHVHFEIIVNGKKINPLSQM